MALSLKSTATPVAFDVHLEYDGMVHKAIDRSNHHGVVWKTLFHSANG